MELQTTGTIKLSTRGLDDTYKTAVTLFNRFVKENPSGDPVHDFFAHLKKNRSIATLQTYKAAIKKAVISDLKRRGLDNSATLAQLDATFKEIKTGTRDIKVSKEEILSPSELKDLVTVSGEKTSLIIRALYQTGSRVTELINIRFTDCMKTSGGMIIRVTGKGTKERTVFMSTELYWEIRKAYRGQAYLFENIQTGKPISRKTVHGLIKVAGAKIGRPDIHAHTLRHSFATNRLDDLGIDAVSEYLGHSSPEITAKYYLHKKPTISSVLQGELF